MPFYAQTTDQCGPAALATVLNVAGVDTTADELRNLTYIPERQGSLQAELLGTTRRFHRIPYRIDPTGERIFAEPLISADPIYREVPGPLRVRDRTGVVLFPQESVALVETDLP